MALTYYVDCKAKPSITATGLLFGTDIFTDPESNTLFITVWGEDAEQSQEKAECIADILTVVQSMKKP